MNLLTTLSKPLILTAMLNILSKQLIDVDDKHRTRRTSGSRSAAPRTPA